MIKNLKLDIIYYMVGTDFEMEFNLGGCAQMRLLTDTVENRSDFSKALARSVGRSNIIISCGPIFGEKGLINTVAKITNIGTEKLNKEKYGVDSNGEIDLLKGSTPLVTSNGIFGGCIIENGNQVIIILSESKSLRKQLMKELIHPYITQWSFMMSDDVDAKPTLPIEKAGEDDAEKEEISEPESENNSESVAEESAVSDILESDAAKVTEPENNVVFSNREPDNKDLDGFILSDGEVGQEPANKPIFNQEVFERNQAYYNYEFSESDNESVDQRNYRYLVEDFEEAKPKSIGKGLFIFFLIITIVLALAIVFFAVIRPLILGYDLSAYFKSIFKPSETALVKCFFL